LHGKAPIELRAATNWTLDICSELFSVKEDATVPKKQRTEAPWQSPPTDSLKINVDGAFIAEENSGAVGAVARNVNREFFLAMSRRLPVVATALASEAEALREGV
jgi:hypothetical protein